MLQDEAKVQSEDKGCRAFEATGGSDGKESACSTGNPRLIPGVGRSPGEGNGNTGAPLQYSCLEDSMNREAWRATVHRVAKSRM